MRFNTKKIAKQLARSIFLSGLLLTPNLYAQLPVSQMPEETTPVAADLLYLVKTPGGAGTSRKVTVTNLTKGLGPFSYNPAGTDNEVFGKNSGLGLIAGGQKNVIIGNNAGASLSTGDANVLIGSDLAPLMTTGSNNTLIGYGNADNLTTASNNTGIGGSTLEGITTGLGNIAIGVLNSQRNQTGSFNICIGNNTAIGVVGNSHNNNLFIGQGVASGVTTSSNNVVLGYNSGNLITSGGTNTILGVAAGNQITTGTGNVIIGNGAASTSGNLSNRLQISNANDTTPLIDGDFATDILTVNGVLLPNSLRLSSGGVANITANAGRLFFATNGQASPALIISDSGAGTNPIELNAQGTNSDVRIRADVDPDMFYMNADIDSIGIGTSTPEAKFHIVPASGMGVGTDKAFKITTTLPATLTADASVSNHQITTAGSSAFATNGINLDLLAGYTGSVRTTGINVTNAAAGTASNFLAGLGNIGYRASISGTTNGHNVAYWGEASGGNRNVAISGRAVGTKNSAWNIGVFGASINGGTSPIQVGGYFQLANALPSITTSAALVADNIAQPNDILQCKDNTVDVFVVADGGLATHTQVTPGNPLISLVTTTTNDDPTVTTSQNRVATTDATVTTLHTVAITASRTYKIKAEVIARRTGGSAGTADDGASYTREWAFTTKAGVVTQLGADGTIFTAEDQAGWNVTAAVSGTNVLIQVTGATNNNVTWHLMKCEVSSVGS